MRKVKYKTFWSYAGPGVKREGTLVDLVLDILYLMEGTGVIPPLQVLNEVLQGGGSNGGMGPGTSWRRFKISAEEYQEFVENLLKIDPQTERARHPYIRFSSVIIDSEFENSPNYLNWLQKVHSKYGTMK